MAKPEPSQRPVAASEGSTLRLVAANRGCTKMACSKENPCCNRCQYGAWQAKGAGRDSYLKLCGVAVPAPEQDGCGVAFDLELTGRSNGRCFSVQSFKKLPPSGR